MSNIHLTHLKRSEYIKYFILLKEKQVNIMNSSAAQQIYETSCRILGTDHFILTKNPSEALWMNRVLVIIFNGILIIPTILLNAVSIMTIWKSSQLKRKPCYFIILVQSVTDLSVGFVGIPLFIFYLWSGLGGYKNYCSLAYFAFRSILIPIGLSTFTLLALTLERYISIVHPYSYNTKVTKKRLLIFIGSCEALELCALLLSLRIHWILEVCGVIKLTSIFLFIAFAYTKIYLVVRRLSRSQRKPQDTSSEENLTRMKLFLREVEQAKACFIVVICFCILSFLPGIIALAIFPMLNSFEQLAVSAWAFTLSLSNSSANSIIYFWTKTMLRKEALKILKITTSQ